MKKIIKQQNRLKRHATYNGERYILKEKQILKLNEMLLDFVELNFYWEDYSQVIKIANWMTIGILEEIIQSLEND